MSAGGRGGQPSLTMEPAGQLDPNYLGQWNLVNLIKQSPARFVGTEQYREMLDLLQKQMQQPRPQSRASLLMGF